MRYCVLIFAVLLILGIGILPSTVVNSIPTVDYILAKPKTIEEKISCSGTVEVKNEKEIYLQTPVIATQVNFDIGDYVNQNDVIATIDSELTKAVITQAEAVSVQSINQTQLSELAKKYGYNISDFSDSKYDDVKEETVYIPNVIVSPMSGIITSINLKSDVLSQTSTPIITIADPSEYKVKVSVGESDVARISLGDNAIIMGSGFQYKKYFGFVSKIYPTARKSTDNNTVVDIEITVEESDKDLKSGFSANVDIIVGEDKTVLSVPYTVVKQDKDNIEYVLTYSGGQVIKQKVQTGLEMLESVEIISGLEENSIIVYDENNKVAEGDFIHIKERYSDY